MFKHGDGLIHGDSASGVLIALVFQPIQERAGRMRKRIDSEVNQVVPPTGATLAEDVHCWLCQRPLGLTREWHHPLPKSRRGRETVPVHPICHRTIHAIFSNSALARFGMDRAGLVSDPAIARFIAWIADKPPDFHAPTRAPR